MVISVEPQPDNIEFLKENIRLNSLTNVRVITKALYFQDELAVPFMGNGVGGHLSKSGSIMVETISLKTVVSMLHGKEFWIKMDIEGERNSFLQGTKI
jgi:FkbM family methyltransferase